MESFFYTFKKVMCVIIMVCELLWYVLLQKSPDLDIMICVTIMICVNTLIMICVTIMICVFPSTHISDM